MSSNAARKPSGAPAPASVLSKAVVRAAEHLQLSRAALGRVLGLSAASVSRLRQGKVRLLPDSKAGELGLLLVRLFRSLDSIVGDGEAARSGRQRRLGGFEQVLEQYLLLGAVHQLHGGGGVLRLHHPPGLAGPPARLSRERGGRPGNRRHGPGPAASGSVRAARR